MSNGKYVVELSGLIGFVPSADKKRMRLLFVDASENNYAADGETIFPHYAFIHFALDDLDPQSPRRPDLIGKGHGLCFLNREDLTIGDQPDTEKADLTFRLSEQPLARPVMAEPLPSGAASGVAAAAAASRPTEPTDLSWIMPLGHAANVDALEVDDRCLADPYQVVPDRNPITARARLCTGALSVRDFRRKTLGGEPRNAVCSFSVNGGGCHWRQVLATRVDYELPGDKKLEIASRRFEEPASSSIGLPRLAFRQPDGRDVRIRLWNAPFSDILDLLGERSAHQWPRPHGDRSFRAFYRLAATPPRDLPELSRVAVQAASYQALYLDAKKDVGCPSGRYAPHERA